LRRARNRRAQIDQQLRVSDLLERSAAARRTLARSHLIIAELRFEKKVWPLARVAKLFTISPSLLRKWTECGILSRSRLPKPYRPGVTERSIRNFLRHLTDEAEFLSELIDERRRPAEERCREAAKQLGLHELLTPVEFAVRARVSVATVRRMEELRIIRGYRPTAHRTKICHWRWKKTRKNS